MHYALEYDVYGEHRVRVEKIEEEGKKPQYKVTRIGDEAGEPSVDRSLPLHQLHLLWAVAKDLEKRKRQIPVTKSEAERFLSKGQIKKLVNGGLLCEKMLEVYKNGKRDGMRSCLPFTELGRRYCRSMHEKISSHAERERSHSDGSISGVGESTDSGGQEAASSSP